MLAIKSALRGWRTGRQAGVLKALCCAVVLTASIPTAVAQQDTSGVSEEDIERVRQNLPDITERDIGSAVQQHGRLPTTGSAPIMPSTPEASIEKLPQPLTAERVDIGKIAEGFAATAPADLGVRAGPQLVVFASFSMPEGSWVKLLAQAERIGAPILLRGLEQGSLRKTVARLHKLQRQRAVNVQIDPQAFDRYKVNTVPTFVLTKPEAAQSGCGSKTCMSKGTYAKVIGDVSIDYALERMGERHPSFAREARALLTRVRGVP